jgi:gliding motility-associated-like protein
MKRFPTLINKSVKWIFKSFGILAWGLPCHFAIAQDCPQNIDFEKGTFEGWIPYAGFVVDRNNSNVIRLSPTSVPAINRHTIYASSPINGLDPYGKFPINPPNGSNYAVKLGNEGGGALAEGISYDFTIPANQDLFTIFYHYAIVFQKPEHLEHQQPRFEVEVTNLTRNERIGCSSFEFRPFDPLTPGFDTTFDLINNVPVWYKEWTSVSINLDGHAGQTIRIFFRVADCTFFDHFSYAYVDVNTECNGEFPAGKYCPGDTVITLAAPPGYQNYTWYDRSFTQVLGQMQTINVTPQIIAGGTIPVEIIPSYGYGCIDTFYTTAAQTFSITANGGPDMFSCNNDSVIIGGASAPGLVYNWSPLQGLSDAAIANPLANPVSPTNYILTVKSIGGGCTASDTVFVNKSFVNDSLLVSGEPNYCIGSGSPPLLQVQLADSIQWFRDNVAINVTDQQDYFPSQSGTYYAVLFNQDGCRGITNKQIINIDSPQKGINYSIQYTVAGLPTTLTARDFGDIVLWEPAFNLNDPALVSPVFTGSTDQSYTIEIKTNSGCVTIDTQLVKIAPRPDIYVPTAFSPNQDGRNDILRPILIGIKELRYFKIFNRWGQLVFETKTSGVGWDGIIKGEPVPVQAVVWMAEGLGWDNKMYQRKGVTTIVR